MAGKSMMAGVSRAAIAALVLALAASPAVAATSADKTALATVKIVKPLVLTWIQDLDLGTVILSGPGTWSGATFGITRAGTLTCGNANLTCSGATAVAKYNVSGTNSQVVTITAPNVTMVNQSDPTKTLTLVLDAPPNLTLTNSGVPGQNFSVGGSIAVASSTSGGLYTGTLNITVDY
jgi:hypothetical protein